MLLNTKVVLGDPLYNLKGVRDFDTKENWVFFANVTGLALHAIETKKEQSVNLISKENKKEKNFLEKWWN